MLSKNRLKQLSAYRMRKHCDADAVFVCEGDKLAQEALNAGIKFETVCATTSWIEQHPSWLTSSVIEVSDSELSRLSSMSTPQGIWMLIRRDQIAPRSADDNGLILALDHIQDPGNLGTIMRTADWFGIRKIVCSRDTVNCFNPKVIQATMGAIFRTEIDYVDLNQWLRLSKRPIYGASLSGTPVTQVSSPPSNSILVIGNESNGISPDVMTTVHFPILIPNIGATAESLNAAVAAGILIGWMKLFA